MNVSEVCEAALSYLDAGYSVIPTLPGDKRPCVPWKEFQERQATRAEVRTWYRQHPTAGVAIVCGTVSGLVVVDGDPRNGDGLDELAPRLPPTPTVETGGGGRHFYLRTAPGTRIPKVPRLLPGVDLQAEGSYVVAPPTIHRTGRPYRWLPALGLTEVLLAPLPSLVWHLLALHRQMDKSSETSRTRRVVGWLGLSLESALANLEGVRRSGRGWLARCPSHQDRRPSLSIRTGEAGRLLIHCHAGCTFADVLHALGDKGPVA